MTKRRSARADKTRKAAAHGFEKWYKAEEDKMIWGTIPCTLEDSPLYEAMQCTPHMVLCFLLNAVQRLVAEYWVSSAASEAYVAKCVVSMKKCPPFIIALLEYLKSPSLTLPPVNAIPRTSKEQSSTSGVARASTQWEASAPASASASVAAGNEKDEFAICWLLFDDNVMKHLVWPAVRAG